VIWVVEDIIAERYSDSEGRVGRRPQVRLPATKLHEDDAPPSIRGIAPVAKIDWRVLNMQVGYR
jgi:hypothetical protein